MPDSHKNFAYSTIAVAPIPATSGTAVTVQTGDGAKFPTVPFNATIWVTGANPLTSNAEIVRVTLIVSDVLTIVRAQEGTVARTVVVGDQIAATITAKTLTDVELLSIATAANTANYTIVSDNYIILSDLTGQASRNVVLPSSSTGKVLIIKNKNVDDNGFYWTFTNGTVKDFAENTVTQLLNTIVYQLVYDGTNWNIIN